MKNDVLIIAEAGVNHNGDIDLAKKLIDLAKTAGVDYVKFQTWVTEELVDESAPKADYQKQNDGTDTSQFEMLKKLELSFEDFIELKRYADSIGVGFLSTPDEEKSLKFLSESLNLPLLKIGSGEVTNLPFLHQVGKTGKDIILSTGMSNFEEVKIAFDTLISAGAKSVALLHCTSNYPAKFESINLKAMLTLKELTPIIGYSDHTEGNEVSIAAVALGANIIEKHFTLDKNLPGPDHKASMSPEELILLVKQIRNTEKALQGSGIKEITNDEVETKSIVQKGLFWKKSLNTGHLITLEDIVAKRPVVNIPVSEINDVIGKRIRHDVNANTPINFIDFE